MTTNPLPRSFARLARSVRTTPGQLRGMLAGVGVLATIAFAITTAAVRQHRQGVQTVGRDAAPSIVAAQRVKAGLAAMHGHAADGLLGRADAVQAYDAQRAEVVEGLMTAAGNVTYGDTERGPIRTMLNGVGRYEGAVTAARALAARGDRDGMTQQVREADRVMRTDLLPAADALDLVNSAELDREYTAQKRWGIAGRAAVLAAGLLLAAALVGVQVYLRRRTRRVFNPALVLATAAAVGFTGYTLVALDDQRRDLKWAREDAFASVQVLRQARADGYDALAADRLGRLDPARKDDAGRVFDAAVGRLATTPPGMTLDALAARFPGDTVVPKDEVPAGFEGQLAVELRNITFVGEQAAANATLRSFAGFVAAVRGGADPDPAFARFLADLGRVTDINDGEFARAVEQGTADLDGFDAVTPVALLGVFALTALGIRPRLREYAF